MDFSKQFAVIEKLKSLVKMTGGFRKKGSDKNQVTEDVAKKIQKSSYDKSHHEYADVFTPPYKTIAEQLQVSNDQIYEAAVFNLATIAINRKMYAKEIISLLETSMEDKKRTPEQKEYIQFKIGQIKESMAD